eukprot:2723474-Prymnesium_polylepis.1
MSFVSQLTTLLILKYAVAERAGVFSGDRSSHSSVQAVMLVLFVLPCGTAIAIIVRSVLVIRYPSWFQPPEPKADDEQKDGARRKLSGIKRAVRNSIVCCGARSPTSSPSRSPSRSLRGSITIASALKRTTSSSQVKGASERNGSKLVRVPSAGEMRRCLGRGISFKVASKADVCDGTSPSNAHEKQKVPAALPTGATPDLPHPQSACLSGAFEQCDSSTGSPGYLAAVEAPPPREIATVSNVADSEESPHVHTIPSSSCPRRIGPAEYGQCLRQRRLDKFVNDPDRASAAVAQTVGEGSGQQGDDAPAEPTSPRWASPLERVAQAVEELDVEEFFCRARGMLTPPGARNLQTHRTLADVREGELFDGPDAPIPPCRRGSASTQRSQPVQRGRKWQRDGSAGAPGQSELDGPFTTPSEADVHSDRSGNCRSCFSHASSRGMQPSEMPPSETSSVRIRQALEAKLAETMRRGASWGG